MTSTELSKRFLLWFQNEYPTARIYRNNAGCFKTQAGSWVRYGIPNSGSPDFLSFTPDNNILRVDFYEIKTIKDRLSLKQKQFADLIKSMNGKYYIVKELKNGEFEINEY
jgi:hypothetical protein